MDTTITEIAAGIYRLSTFTGPANFMFNQFVVVADEPLPDLAAGYEQRLQAAIGPSTPV